MATTMNEFLNHTHHHVSPQPSARAAAAAILNPVVVVPNPFGLTDDFPILPISLGDNQFALPFAEPIGDAELRHSIAKNYLQQAMAHGMTFESILQLVAMNPNTAGTPAEITEARQMIVDAMDMSGIEIEMDDDTCVVASRPVYVDDDPTQPNGVWLSAWIWVPERVEPTAEIPVPVPVPVQPLTVELCKDEGCDHFGTPHVCVAIAVPESFSSGTTTGRVTIEGWDVVETSVEQV